jgi:hypothetical protein
MTLQYSTSNTEHFFNNRFTPAINDAETNERCKIEEKKALGNCVYQIGAHTLVFI